MDDALRSAIVRVGDGRGFLVKTNRVGRVVLTAAHCLPQLPPAHPAAHTEERTYKNILGPLSATPEVSAECLFVNPIRDLAVLCEPDSQTYRAESRKYEHFVDDRSTISIGLFQEPEPGCLLTLDGTWERCELGPSGWTAATIRISDTPDEGCAPGTSGSPILNAEGCAVGVISDGEDLNPALAVNLPVEIVAESMGNRAVDAVQARARIDEKRMVEIAVQFRGRSPNSPMK